MNMVGVICIKCLHILVHFIEAVVCDRPVLVTAEEARNVMEVYMAADLSAERNEPVNLPLPESRPLAAAGGAR